MIQRIITTVFLGMFLLSLNQAYASQDDPGFSSEWIAKLVQSARQEPGPDDPFTPLTNEEIEVALGLSSKNPEFERFKRIYGGTAQEVFERGILKQKIGLDYRFMEGIIEQAGPDTDNLVFFCLKLTLPVAYPPQLYKLAKLGSLSYTIASGGDLNKAVGLLDLCSFRLIAELQSLRALSVMCSSEVFPVGFGLCQQLTELKVQTALRDVYVDIASDLFELTNLEKLDLSVCQLKSLPNGIGRLEKLVQLDISGNVCTEISDEIGKLGKLRVLNASLNRLTSLPDTFTQLTFLETLNLGMNQFEVFPFLLGTGVFPSLKVLSVWNSRLKQIPEQLGGLKALQELYVGDNPFESMPDCLHQMTNLQKLDVSRILIAQPLPPACLPPIWKATTLTSLSLESCKFGALPSDIEHLKQLTTLNLRNAFVMDELHPVLYTLTNLVELNVSATGLKIFPTGLSAFKHLGKLNIGGNLFDLLSETAPDLPCLKSLSLGNYDNRNTGPYLSKLPEWIGNFIMLEELSADYCNLSSLPDSIGRLVKLKSLIICFQKNGLKTLPGSIVNLGKLEFLNIDGDGVETLPYALKLLVDSGQLNINGFTGKFLPPASGWWCSIQ